MATTISTLTANLMRQAQAQSLIAQNQNNSTDSPADNSSPQTGQTTVAEALAPDSPSLQAALSVLAPALNAHVEGRIGEAIGLAGEFHNNFSIIQPALSAFEFSIAASQSQGVGRANQISVSEQFAQGLRQFAGIFGGQGTPYASVTPDSTILALGASEGKPLVDLLL